MVMSYIMHCKGKEDTPYWGDGVILKSKVSIIPAVLIPLPYLS